MRKVVVDEVHNLTFKIGPLAPPIKAASERFPPTTAHPFNVSRPVNYAKSAEQNGTFS
jgi:hypothetical protein